MKNKMILVRVGKLKKISSRNLTRMFESNKKHLIRMKIDQQLLRLVRKVCSFLGDQLADEENLDDCDYPIVMRSSKGPDRA